MEKKITEKVIFLFVDLAKSMNATIISINPSLLAKSPEIPNKQHYVPAFGTNAPLEMSYVDRLMNYYFYPLVENFMITMYLPLFYEVIFFQSLSASKIEPEFFCRCAKSMDLSHQQVILGYSTTWKSSRHFGDWSIPFPLCQINILYFFSIPFQQHLRLTGRTTKGWSNAPT